MKDGVLTHIEIKYIWLSLLSVLFPNSKQYNLQIPPRKL